MRHFLYLPKRSKHSHYIITVLVEIEEAVKKMAAGQDPISVYEARVQVVQSELVKKAGELGKLEHTLQTEFVPKASKDIVDESLMEAKVSSVVCAKSETHQL